MGCEFTLRILTLVGGKWIPVLTFGTKTKCGGHPLAHAPRIYAFWKNTTIGKYGAEFPTIAKWTDKAVKDCYFGVPSGKDKSKLKACNTSENDCLYLSRSEFIMIRKLLYPQLYLDQFYASTYFDMMEPMDEWMNMALTSAPIGEDVWMGSHAAHIASVTQSLVDGQQKLRDWYKESLQVPEGTEVDYSKMPVGQDVRVMWYDEEEQCTSLLTKVPEVKYISPKTMQIIEEIFKP